MEVVDIVDEMVEKENHNSHELDLTLEGYTYIHYPSPDGTDYNDDENDNILHPADYIIYPEAGAIAAILLTQLVPSLCLIMEFYWEGISFYLKVQDTW